MSATILSMLLVGWLVAGRMLERERIARACHELRGPLHAAGLALDVMARRGEAPEPRIVALDAQLRRARVALDDLAGAPPARPDGMVDLAAFASELRAVWEPVARAHARGLVVRCCAEAEIAGDAVRLHQALGNLIANALEHGEGTVRVLVDRTPRHVVIDVRDEGPGLPRRVRRRRAGRGRGLGIAARIARSHGGALRLVPGGGPVLELPVEAPRAVRTPIPGRGWRAGT